MTAKTLPLFAVISILILSGCGSRSSDPVAAAATSKDSKQLHDQAVSGFASAHPAQSLTVSGVVDVGGGVTMDVADGRTNYQHLQARIGYQDSTQQHGTLTVSLEDGIVAAGLYQTPVIVLPHVIGVSEAADSNNFVASTFSPFCTANGVTVQIVGYDSANGGTGQDLFLFSVIDPPSIYDQPEKHWPSPLYMDSVQINVATDLCSFITVKPTVTMKF